MERINVHSTDEIEQLVMNGNKAAISLDNGVIEVYKDTNGFINCEAWQNRYCIDKERFYEWNEDVLIWIDGHYYNFVRA